MSTFKVDKEQINDSVETLKKLLEECEEAYNKEIPESTQDKGQTHNELNELCNNLKSTCYCLGELINKTILFLGETSEMFETSDQESAAAITEPSTTTVSGSGTIHGGGGTTISNTSTSETNVSNFDQKVAELQSLDGFKQGDSWGWQDHYQGDYKGYYIDAWSCCAKAKQMQIEVTGTLGTYTGITDASEIKAGDVIHYYYPGTYWFEGKEYPNEHWVFVTGVNGNIISIGEGNYSGEIVNYRNLDLSVFSNGYSIESIYR